MDELFRFIQVYDPKELILVKKNVNMSNDKLSNYLELNNRIVHYKEYDQINSQYFNISYQRQFLEKIFKNHGFDQRIQELALSFCLQNSLVDFVIPGMMSIQEVDGCLKSLEVKNFPKDLLSEIEEFNKEFNETIII